MAIDKTRAGSLAALAGLAYMASQKGKKGEDSGLTAADREDAEMGKAMGTSAGAALGAANQAKEPPAPFEADFPRQDSDYAPKAAEKMLAPKAVSRPRPAAAKAEAEPDETIKGVKTTSDKRGVFQGAMRGMRSGDGGKSVVDKQNAEMAKSGQTPEEYVKSGKKRVGNLASSRFKGDSDITGVRPYSESSKDREPASDLASAYSGADMYKRGGKVKKMASGGMTSSASKRADGIATKGKTRGRMC